MLVVPVLASNFVRIGSRAAFPTTSARRPVYLW